MPQIELSDIADGAGGFVINGECADDRSGFSVAGAGDVNGDGLADLIVGAHLSDPGAYGAAGRSYVVFGQTGTLAIDLSAIEAGTGGFVINGQCADDYSGFSVASVGDIDGDGLADLIVGAKGSAATAGSDAGRSYVVFGTSESSAIELSAIEAGIGGFVINGQCADDLSGGSIAGAGDVNGDGLVDLIVGGHRSDPAAGIDAGRSYVVYGQSGSGAIELSAIEAGTGGFVVNGQCEDDYSGFSVAGAGDVNGDGLADLIVGAYGSDLAGGDAGRSYVVFGQSGGSIVDLSAVALGTGGFVINGQCEFDRSGRSVAGAGDVNGDGLADLIVGMYASGPAAATEAGRSYVVFGQSGSSPVDLSAVAAGSGGFVINGECATDQSGRSVAGAGDVNGDGLADLIVGAPSSDPAAGESAGRSYVVFGQSESSAIDLSAIAAGSGGFVINGQGASDYSGGSVAAAGDVNGDGLADLIVGASGRDPIAGGDAGRSYVIFGSTTGAFAQTAVDQFGDSGDNTLTGSVDAETLVGGEGNDTLIGNGDADVLYGGAGNDSFVLNESNVAALGANFGAVESATQLSRVDGGSGLDSLALDGAGIALDLPAIANQGASTPGSASRLEAIERIDLTGSGNNTLTLGANDVIDIAGMNLINSATQLALGWTDGSNGGGTYTFAPGEGRHQLIVDGDAGDAVTVTGSTWTSMGTVTHDGDTYTVYNSDAGLAQVLVANAVTHEVPAAVHLSAIADGAGGFVINGECAGDLSGFSVAGAGDVNGDGLADLIVGAYRSDPGAADAAGRSYVVFGQTGILAIDLSAIEAGTGGFVIDGQCAGDRSGVSVASAGDVNGDGLADLIVGANLSSPAAGGFAGRSYVVFGTSESSPIDLSSVAQGTGGFVMNGQGAYDQSGRSVAGAGDVNGDGLADLIVGAYRSESDPDVGNAGRSYVVYGRTGTIPIDLSAIEAGIGGFVINGQCAYDRSGGSVAGAGDVNGDGLADLIVGASQNSPAAGSYAGSSYVVFGQSGSNAIDLSAVAAGTGGFVINGQCAYDRSGTSVAGAGDVNGDGLADLIVGANESVPAAGGFAGRSYVVFGQSGESAIDLSAVAAGTGGFVINGQCAGDFSGGSVAGAGDVNGDGLADLIVGARNSDAAVGTNAGRSYLVFGKSTGDAIDLSAIAAGTGGFVIDGECAYDRSGASVASAGDVNGDGLADLIVGADGSVANAGGDAGRSYVIFGSTTGAFAQTAVDQFGDSGDNTLTGSVDAETLVGGEGNDTLIGNGDADVLYGGAGNDTFILNESNVAALSANFGAEDPSQLSRVDGGSGLDTLALDGAGIALDLSAIANQGASAPGSASRLEAIERIDLTGSGNNTLTLGVQDVIDIAGMNLINGSTHAGLGWTDGSNGGGTYTFAASEVRHQLIIDANAGDAFVMSGAWTAMGTVTHDSNIYTVFNSETGLAQLLVSKVLIQTSHIGLPAIAAGTGGFVINGECAGDLSGFSVAGAGDVNGDGLADLIVGAYRSDPAASADAGRSYVVFGKSGGGAIDLSAVEAGTGGFVINGQGESDYSGISVAGAGDINGDGLADLIVGAFFSDPAAAAQAGRSYVVFGRCESSAIDLSAVEAGTGGFVINGQCAYDLSGGSVAGAGDVNGDGLADLVVGAFQSYPAAGENAGRSYVVFGQSSGSAIDLSAVAAGSGGFVINGQCEGDQSGGSVAGAGDVNGDGLADVIVGAKFSDPAAGNGAGRSYVVFGKSEGGVVDLSAVEAGTGGFVINGHCVPDLSGSSVAGAGDINGDGLADLIVGVGYSDAYAGIDAGRSYVVFGKSGSGAVDLSAVANGAGGFVINGECADDRSGWSVAGAGDVNGDGLADLIVGALGSDPAAGIDAGRSYVVFGQSGSGAIDLSAVAGGTGGFVINGQCADDRSGGSVAGGGDINGDGLADLVVGAGYGDPVAGTNAGRSYVIFGSTTGAFVQTAVDQLGTEAEDTLSGITVAGRGRAETLVGGAGDDTLIGNGGADVLYGGAGNDSLVLNASNIAALSANFGAGSNASQYSRIDGGGGMDTLALAGVGMELDLTVMAAQGAGTPGSASRLESIERIDLTGGGNNILVLAAADLLDLSDGSNTLKVDGDTGDGVTLVNAGSAGVSLSGGYHEFTQGGAILHVNTQIAVTLAGSDELGDLLTGTSSVDSIYGLGGDDEIAGGEGDDTLEGGDGDDVLDGSGGSDRASYSEAAAGVAVSLALDGPQDTVGAGIDRLIAIEHLTGSAFDDTLTGSSSANTLSGGNGDDTLNGSGGSDTLDGGTGTDTASYAGAAAGVTVTLAVATAQNTSGAGTDTLTSIENLTGSDFNDTLSGENGANTLIGGDGNDTLNGGAGDDALNGDSGSDTASYAGAGGRVFVSLAVIGAQDTDAGGTDMLDSIENLTGGDSNDRLTGDESANRLDGGAGTDRLIGGAGSDTYVVNTSSDVLTEDPDGGTDLAQSRASSYTLAPNVEDLKLLGTGNLKGTGNSSNNELTGNSGNNTLTGGGGNDTLIGGSGTDTLTGGSGNDTLTGGSGKDVLKGLSGADVLTGGGGADRFDFDAVSDSGNNDATRDEIIDFNRSQGDRIDLSTIDANGAGAGNAAFKFIGGAAFSRSNATGQLRFNAANDRLLGSTDADATAEFSILLSNLNSMVVGDFIL